VLRRRRATEFPLSFSLSFSLVIHCAEDLYFDIFSACAFWGFAPRRSLLGGILERISACQWIVIRGVTFYVEATLDLITRLLSLPSSRYLSEGRYDGYSVSLGPYLVVLRLNLGPRVR